MGIWGAFLGFSENFSSVLRGFRAFQGCSRGSQVSRAFRRVPVNFKGVLGVFK